MKKPSLRDELRDSFNERQPAIKRQNIPSGYYDDKLDDGEGEESFGYKEYMQELRQIKREKFKLKRQKAKK